MKLRLREVGKCNQEMTKIFNVQAYLVDYRLNQVDSDFFILEFCLQITLPTLS